MARFNIKSGLVARYISPTREWGKLVKRLAAAWSMPSDLPFHRWTLELQAAALVLFAIWEKEALNLPMVSRKNAYRIGKILLSKEGRSLFGNLATFAKGKEGLLRQALNRPKFFALLLRMKPSELAKANIKTLGDLKAMQMAYKAGGINVDCKIAKAAGEYAHLEDFESHDWKSYQEIWDTRKPFVGKKVAGKVGNISYEVLSNDDASALFLDDASDCCQGLDGAGEACMRDGISNPKAGFLVFKRKGKIFAQSWIRLLPFGNGILLDSIEFKGDYNDSIAKAVNSAIADFKSHYEFVAVGFTPNRGELNRHFKPTNSNIAKKVCNWASHQDIYTDADIKVAII